MAGAVGNYNAHLAAYSGVAWDGVARGFVASLGLQWNPCVTQVCPPLQTLYALGTCRVMAYSS
jgi:adenylosuccinate lyase